MSSILDDILSGKDCSALVKKTAANSKYSFDTRALYEGFDIPKNTSVQTMRVTVSKWHSENVASGKRFKVFANERKVVRVK